MAVALRHPDSLLKHAQHVAPLPDTQKSPGQEEVAEQIVESIPDFERQLHPLAGRLAAGAIFRSQATEVRSASHLLAQQQSVVCTARRIDRPTGCAEVLLPRTP